MVRPCPWAFKKYPLSPHVIPGPRVPVHAMGILLSPEKASWRRMIHRVGNTSRKQTFCKGLGQLSHVKATLQVGTKLTSLANACQATFCTQRPEGTWLQCLVNSLQLPWT